MTLYKSILSSPIGDIIALSSSKGICYLMFRDHPFAQQEIEKLAIQYNAQIIHGVNRHIESLQKELESYFSKELEYFTTVLDINGSPMALEVYDQLCTLRYGQIITYKEQAHLLGKPTSVRPVASANAKNRIMILVPCHRVVGANGKLSGYAGGLHRKQYLIDLETNAPRMLL